MVVGSVGRCEALAQFKDCDLKQPCGLAYFRYGAG